MVDSNHKLSPVAEEWIEKQTVAELIGLFLLLLNALIKIR